MLVNFSRRMPCQSGPCCRSTSADTKSQGDQVTQTAECRTRPAPRSTRAEASGKNQRARVTQTAECRTGPLLPRHPLGKTNTSLHFRQPSSNGWSGVRSANAAWPLAVHASAPSSWLPDSTSHIPPSKCLPWFPYALEMPSSYDSHSPLPLVRGISP